MDLMKQFADPELIQSLTMSQKLAGTGITAIMGMGVTFIVLLFLWGSIAMMARIMCRNLPTDNKVMKTACEDIVTLPPVAVIAAAVAAYEENGTALVVKKIVRLSGKPAWSQSVTERGVFK